MKFSETKNITKYTIKNLQSDGSTTADLREWKMENIPIRKNEERVSGNEILRSVPGYTVLHQKRNTHIRSELKIFNSRGQESKKENWYEHILRMPTNRHAKITTKL
jgi:hypothetical protein